MARPKLTLFVDIVSPFAYMAWYVTSRSQTFKQCDVTYVPILLGGVMKACGNRAPIEIKNKDVWINKERVRWAKQFKIPIAEKSPEPFPQSTVQAQRALCAIQLLHPNKLQESIDALYRAFWIERQTISKPETVAGALAKVLGEADAKTVMEKATSPEAKKMLSENSDQAMAEGAFGLPYFVATNAQGEKETYWGFDHLGQVVDHLGLNRKDEGFRAML